MLVLSRRDGEEIVVGENVVIKVLASSGGRVRIGIEAPRNVSIRRAELADNASHEDRQCIFASVPSNASANVPMLAGCAH